MTSLRLSAAAGVAPHWLTDLRRYAWPRLASVGASLILWEVAGRGLGFRFLPPFSQVAAASWQIVASGEIAPHLAMSMATLLLGYSLGAGLGIVLGALMGRYRIIDHALGPYVALLLASPSLIYVPVLFALFGVSRVSQVALIMLYVLQVTIPNATTGVRSVSLSLIDMARMFGASRWQVLRRVLLPGALPFILAGLRIGMGRAFKGMINGEMLIAVVGLGAIITRYGTRFNVEKVLGVLLIVVALAVLASAALRWFERRATRWMSDAP